MLSRLKSFALTLEFFALALQLHLLLLHSLEACSKTAHLFRVVLVLLVLSLKDSEELLVVGSLAEDPHDSSAEEERDEVVEVKTCRVVVEHEEEHNRHEEHHLVAHVE